MLANLLQGGGPAEKIVGDDLLLVDATVLGEGAAFRRFDRVPLVADLKE